MLRILHAADLHLDQPFAFLEKDKAERMRRELQKTLLSLGDTVREKEVSLVLLAGDMLHHPDYTEECAKIFVSALENIPCPVVISPGNHDYVREDGFWKKVSWPENVHVFLSEEPETLSLPELSVEIGGYAFCHEHLDCFPMEGFSFSGEGKTRLLCIHADEGVSSSSYAPAPIGTLERIGAVYTALGHVHNPPPPVRTPDGHVIAYSASMAGHGYDETGERGALLVTVDPAGDGRVVSMEKIPMADYRFETAEVPVGGLSSAWDAYLAYKKRSEEIPKDPRLLLLARFTGEVAPEFRLDKERILGEAHPWLDLRVEDATTVTPDPVSLREDATLRGGFYRLLEPELTSSDEKRRLVAREALRIGLAALGSRSGK